MVGSQANLRRHLSSPVIASTQKNRLNRTLGQTPGNGYFAATNNGNNFIPIANTYSNDEQSDLAYVVN